MGADGERATLDEKSMQYLYSDGSSYHFMDTDSYEQIALSDEVLGDMASYLIPEMVIEMEFYGSEPVGNTLTVQFGRSAMSWMWWSTKPPRMPRTARTGCTSVR